MIVERRNGGSNQIRLQNGKMQATLSEPYKESQNSHEGGRDRNRYGWVTASEAIGGDNFEADGKAKQ